MNRSNREAGKPSAPSCVKARAFGRDLASRRASWPAAHAPHQQVEDMAAPTNAHRAPRSSLPTGSRPDMAQGRSGRGSSLENGGFRERCYRLVPAQSAALQRARPLIFEQV